MIWNQTAPCASDYNLVCGQLGDAHCLENEVKAVYAGRMFKDWLSRHHSDNDAKSTMVGDQKRVTTWEKCCRTSRKSVRTSFV